MVELELEKMKQDVAARKAQRVSIVQLKDYWKSFLVSLILMFFFQFSGFVVLIYYSVTIFSMAESSIDPGVAAIIVGVVMIISTLIAIVVVGRVVSIDNCRGSERSSGLSSVFSLGAS